MNECDKSCAMHGEANVDCAKHGEVAVLRAQVDSLGEALHGAARSLLWVARNRDADGNEVRAYAESRATVASNALDRIRALAPPPTALRSHRCIDDGGDGYECPGCHAREAPPPTSEAIAVEHDHALALLEEANRHIEILEANSRCDLATLGKERGERIGAEERLLIFARFLRCKYMHNDRPCMKCGFPGQAAMPKESP